MTWERGAFLGACDEVGRLRRDANANVREAQGIIDRKNVELAELRRSLAEWREAHAAWKAKAIENGRRVLALEPEVEALRPVAARARTAEAKVADLETRVAELTCREAGESAAAEALYWALAEVAPEHALFGLVGTMPDGRPAHAIDRVTVEASDAKAVELGVRPFAGPVTVAA